MADDVAGTNSASAIGAGDRQPGVNRESGSGSRQVIVDARIPAIASALRALARADLYILIEGKAYRL